MKREKMKYKAAWMGAVLGASLLSQTAFANGLVLTHDLVPSAVADSQAQAIDKKTILGALMENEQDAKDEAQFSKGMTELFRDSFGPFTCLQPVMTEDQFASALTGIFDQFIENIRAGDPTGFKNAVEELFKQDHYDCVSYLGFINSGTMQSDGRMHEPAWDKIWAVASFSTFHPTATIPNQGPNIVVNVPSSPNFPTTSGPTLGGGSFNIPTAPGSEPIVSGEDNPTGTGGTTPISTAVPPVKEALPHQVSAATPTEMDVNGGGCTLQAVGTKSTDLWIFGLLGFGLDLVRRFKFSSRKIFLGEVK